MRRAVFLDRDGVINKLIPRDGIPRAPYQLEDVSIFPGVLEAVAALKAAGFLIIIVTNQPDAVRGWVSFENVHAVNDLIAGQLKVDGVKVCFHDSKDNCQCRKPRPGMLLAAAQEHEIDLPNSFMVGDRFSDVAAGVSAGCTSILIESGDKQLNNPAPDFVTDSLLAASEWILSKKNRPLRTGRKILYCLLFLVLNIASIGPHGIITMTSTHIVTVASA